MIKVAIFGAAGKMGRILTKLGSADPAFQIVAALDVNPEALGKDAGELAGIGPIGVKIGPTLPPDVQPDVLIDFSSAKAFDASLELCLSRKISLVYASTGISDEQVARLEEAAKEICILRSPTMSPTVNVAMRLAKIAAAALKDDDADVEILERHHRFKADSPSGTAKLFGKIVAAEMGIDQFRDGRSGAVGKRPHNEIAYHAIRIGNEVGEHTVIFGMPDETIELTVRSRTRDSYADGAYRAARFLATARPGRLYDMTDALGLN
ncbi:MAG: 4-hydroxy-tetrahydrodipicolinate reductase [Thermoguttaceae bacterium]|nr:4-hydroxy-tetrahydrodipicolinate reductase [Thermoguttaceae bacterium]